METIGEKVTRTRPVRTLMYHDVLDPETAPASGFESAGADLYKVDRGAFGEHLEAIAREVPGAVGSAESLFDPGVAAPGPFITFDDGGVSAETVAAGMLARRGWVGHFFVTTDRIGERGFVSEEDIVALAAEGHVVGSHSCSHPARMSACSAAELEREWSGSCRRLGEILGGEVRTASVPGGFYSPAVAEAAAAAGVRILFTSEPTDRVREVRGCTVLGRYAIRRSTTAKEAAGLAAGRGTHGLRQRLAWDAKKVFKRLGGGLYLRVRERLLRGGSAAG